MNTDIRTTIMIPEELLKAAKIAAVERNTSLSALIKNGLKKEVSRAMPKKKNTGKLTDLLSKYSLGINKIKREDIYDDYFRKRLSP